MKAVFKKFIMIISVMLLLASVILFGNLLLRTAALSGLQYQKNESLKLSTMMSKQFCLNAKSYILTSTICPKKFSK